jgi:hypothetical protein
MVLPFLASERTTSRFKDISSKESDPEMQNAADRQDDDAGGSS